ncbi:hypothetical protein [Nitratifractor salsuginis]|uniref:Uncharacterized protein n=1 Tax=Nitratifractor salsuginis (strain DSM 16511 / JCM 12458 / E9I37-1) TaxID=749222 RepID=E6WY12_NITSE|nr:hypothetical protein [Nitratifractor salsuginis]ADV46386.1 hypothetical protein Nitsa_1132 [Nitratifractor salsuginis DSM 16511]
MKVLFKARSTFFALLFGITTVQGVASTSLTPYKSTMQLGGDLSVDRMRQQNLNVVRKAVEGMRETLPQKVDAYTTLVGVDSNGTRLIYTFEVDAGPKSDEALRKEGRERMAPVIKRGVCQNAKRFLQAGINISYRYLNKTGKNEILRVNVSKNDCPNLKHMNDK